MRTVVIQIGNTDNKLTQNEWSHYCADMKLAIERNVYRVHFAGGSDWDAPWQNACWVCEGEERNWNLLMNDIRASRIRFKQDSVAVTTGDTVLI